jgi:hypothetical protein
MHHLIFANPVAKEEKLFCRKRRNLSDWRKPGGQNKIASAF